MSKCTHSLGGNADSTALIGITSMSAAAAGDARHQMNQRSAAALPLIEHNKRARAIAMSAAETLFKIEEAMKL